MLTDFRAESEAITQSAFDFYHSLGKFRIRRRQIDYIFSLFFSEERLLHFIQIISLGDNLHEMPKPIFC